MSGTWCAGVVELVDAPDSKSGSERSAGSIPAARTIEHDSRLRKAHRNVGRSLHKRTSKGSRDPHSAERNDNLTALSYRLVTQVQRVENNIIEGLVSAGVTTRCAVPGQFARHLLYQIELTVEGCEAIASYEMRFTWGANT